MKFFSHCKRSMGNGLLMVKEKLFETVRFTVFKFNNRPIPKDKRRILIIGCFSEFGCESIGLHYCIPKLISHNPAAYVVAVGWYGREYLYRHLVDEYWEIEESAMFLREYSNAFASTSKNIKRIERALEQHGVVFKTDRMGQMCVGNKCNVCKTFWGGEDPNERCPKCYGANIERSLLADVGYYKTQAVPIPRPSPSIVERAKSMLGRNPVGIFARGRAAYGRNLPSSFYERLISLLESMGYNPIWLGEKQSVLPCPCPRITDFSRMPESRELELTLGIISQLKFTIQFWTASTRFASMMGTPWILFETPDQIVGNGQEGKRIALTTDLDKKKLVLSQFMSALEDQDGTLSLVRRAVEELVDGNWKDVLGQVDNPSGVDDMLKKQEKWRVA